MNVQTGNVTPIIPWEDWKSTFTHSSEWSADGKYILFSKKEPGQDSWELCRIPEGGGEFQTLGLEMENRLMNLSANPNGKKIAFSTSEQTNAEFWEMKNFLPATE